MYALRDLMGHCYVHFAFLFTLIKLAFALNASSILFNQLSYIHLTFDITFGLNATSAFKVTQLLLKTEKGLHSATFAILCIIIETLLDLNKPLANLWKRSLILISIGGLSASNAKITPWVILEILHSLLIAFLQPTHILRHSSPDSLHRGEPYKLQQYCTNSLHCRAG